MKNLRQKFSIIYLCLVIMIAILGIVSVLNFYNLSKTIDGLMTDNYESLKIINNMIEALERQDSAILTYTSGNRELGLNDFNANIDKFLMWYYKEQNNITEAGERELVDQIKEHYMKYINAFHQLSELSDEKNQTYIMEYYTTVIHPIFLLLKDDLQTLWDINETAMFRGKARTTENAQTSTYLILFTSVIAAVGGFFTSRFFANKFTRPVEHLTKSMKEVQAGNLDTRIDVVSDDEIGQLSAEFNKMTEKLLLFERSTLGEVMMEKSKSLAIIKSIADPLMVLDNDYRILVVNKAFESVFQAKETQVHKKHFLEIVRMSELYDYISSILSESNTQHKENIFYLEFGKEHYYFNIIVNKVKDIESKMNGIVVLFQNVTELKELEKMKTNFISTISHEFKTPLTSIMMGTSLLTDCTLGKLNTAQKNVLSSMEEDGQRLANLVDDLLYLSKLESARFVYDMLPAEIDSIIKSTIKPFYIQAANKKIDLQYSVEQKLPKVCVDQEKITWVLNNLIGNAIKYTKANDIISIQVYKQNDKVYISVKDTGIGIPEEYLDRIFEQFVQVENSDLEIRGTGLGLSIAKEIVTAHGGEIWCESMLDAGSCFTFTLPVYRVNT
ncbi:ATP-binding protein [Geosporobacter ferrireducens]|nr:ATP-binding protein [Geosporobacter ferrireducens]MTI56708.1 HAMP domain-containing protein [Geosporobacter ferrireducens]